MIAPFWTIKDAKRVNMALIEVGSPAPAFALPNQDGASVELAQFAGKNLLLWWYPKADTRG